MPVCTCPAHGALAGSGSPAVDTLRVIRVSLVEAGALALYVKARTGRLA